MRRVLVPLLAALTIQATPALAGDPILPLASVKPGMRCKGLTVVKGTQISEFDVEILDVLSGDPTTGARLLVRVSGSAVEPSGIASGFSGSPIYCTDSAGVRRNAGAISETVGEYGNKVGVATPIESILGEPPDPPRGARPAAELLRSARPLATPLTVGGLSTRLERMLMAAGAKARRPVLAAPAQPLGSLPPQQLRPGSSISAGMSSGAIALGGVGTVAYRDGPTIWAFGHPLDALGRRSLYLQDSYVFGVVSNPLGTLEASSYKLAVPGRNIGSITNDALDAVVGRLGGMPREIDLRVFARDLNTKRSFSSRTQIADERNLDLGSALDLAGTLALSQASDTLLRSFPPRLTTSLCLSLRVRERRRPLRFCNDYYDGTGPIADFSTAAAMVQNYEFGPLHLTDVSARMTLRRGVREAFMLRGDGPRRVRAGQLIRIGVVVQERRRRRRERLSFKLRVPRSLQSGRRVLRLTGGSPESAEDAFAEALFSVVFESEEGGADVGGDGDDLGPRSLDQLAKEIASIRTKQGVRGTFARRGQGRVVLPTGEMLVRGALRVPLRVVSGRRR